MRPSLALSALVAAAASLVAGLSRAASLPPHLEVSGSPIAVVEVRPGAGRWRPASWGALGQTPLDPGRYELRITLTAASPGDALQLPLCAGRARVMLDGREVPAPPGPVVLPLDPGAHRVVVALDVSPYERRIACGEPPRVGPSAPTVEGLGLLSFASPHAGRGGGRAVVYVPPGHDLRRPGPLLVGAHPWNGSAWTYAAYEELLREARARDVVQLMPSGLGNSLYTADAEDEVLRAVQALSEVVAVDPRAVSIWGASMGGAGATTIAFHNPDRFAGVTSFFGDSKYDLSTYVRALLPGEAAAHRVNALDVVDNARHLPVWLIHGEADRTSPVRQSELLAAAMAARGFAVRFDRVPGVGHAGKLVARFLPAVVAAAATASAPAAPPRVTYRSVRPRDFMAYGVGIERASPAVDAFVDVELRDDAVHVRAAEGLRALVLARGALGAAREHPPPIVVDDSTAALETAWAPAP